MVTRQNLHRWKPTRPPKEAQAHVSAALRMKAALIALEAPDPEADGWGRTVAVIDQIIRKAASMRLRVAYDGDRYYLTHSGSEAPPPSPHLWADLDGVDGPVTESLAVAGRAEGLEELEALVNQVGAGG